MHDFFILLAICGVVYGAYALLVGTSVVPASQREEIELNNNETRQEAARSGLRGFLFRLVKPIYWVVALPFVSLGGALFIAFLMLLPLLVFK